ncbi:MAG: hypothetical protein GC204_17290 [Chloroflexi bacterium]|nr:hypothetical protein [Chloroflexota bacterium]
MTNNRETTIELITAALLAVIFVLFMLRIFNEGIAMLLGGVILLGSGAYQTSRGWHVSLVTWILGLILALGGIGLRFYLVGVLRINWIPIALLLVALYLVWNWWRKRRPQ